ncbi:MAG: RagB/SusD family nutrient uptake outer membrane protein, partial [Candidatus Cryptobacteroides sp.]
MGLTDDIVYKDYTSVTAYLDNCFNFLEQNLVSHYRGCVRQHVGTLSDEFASVDRDTKATFGNSGNWLRVSRDGTWEFGVNDNQPINLASKGIRIATAVIANIDRAEMSEDERSKVLGQAYFYRAWYYFQLLKRYGGLPILDKPINGIEEQDKPRKTYRESNEWMQTDLDNACAMLPDNWDDKNTGRPTKAAAMALKAMTELYAASPLMQNDLTSIEVREYDKELAAQAAKDAFKTLEYLKTNASYRLMSGEEYKNIFYFPSTLATQPEFIWYNRKYINDGGGVNHPKRTIRSFWLPAQSASGDIQNKDGDASSYNAPTQNMVDMFDKKGSDGIYYPISDSRSGYDPVHSPFEDRDPRFYNDIIVPGESFGHLPNGKEYFSP